LIHLEIKIAHAQHYIGWAKWLQVRIRHHRNGTGAKFLAEAVRREINFDVVRTWENTDGNFERKLKNWKKARMLCPICRQEKK
jgi:predicted GIY-YIG superfamily endonuclease